MKYVLLAFALLAAVPARAADRIELILDWFVNPDHGPVIVAQEKGFFAAEGLEVEITAPSDPSLPPRLVAGGRADIAISYQPQLHLQVHEGLPLVRIGTLVATPLNCLLVVADGPIGEIADLKGGRIGFSVAGVEEALLTTLLGTAGLTLDDVEMINVNWSLSPALMAGQVDAVIGAYRNFELTQMEIDGVPGRCFYIEEHGVPPYDELIFVANRETLNPDLMRRFLAAVEKATQYIVNHPDESWAVFKGTAVELDDALNRQAWIDTVPRFALRPAALDAGRYLRFEEWLAGHGLIDAPLPLGRLAVDPGAL